MALFGNLGGLVGGTLGILGQAYGQTTLGQFGQLGSQIITTSLAQPRYGNGGGGGAPAAGGPVVQTQMPVIGGAMVATAAAAIKRLVIPILIKIAEKLGRRTLTLRQAIVMMRKMGKFITDPAVIATALGISIAEMAQLITAHSHRPARRMNPANVKALRRSMRRLDSFHRLCVRADSLRGRGRRRVVAQRAVQVVVDGKSRARGAVCAP